MFECERHADGAISDRASAEADLRSRTFVPLACSTAAHRGHLRTLAIQAGREFLHRGTQGRHIIGQLAGDLLPLLVVLLP